MEIVSKSVIMVMLAYSKEIGSIFISLTFRNRLVNYNDLFHNCLIQSSIEIVLTWSFLCNDFITNLILSVRGARCWWLTPVILAT
jgi:hypothetical protein